MLTIRSATTDDAERLLAIYDFYVRHTAITFETVTPTLGEFRARMEKTLRRYPYFVIEEDGVIQGYAYAGAFGGRAAYDWCCEMSIYLDRGAQRRGMGRMLYEAMEDALRRMGIVKLYACIAYPEESDETLSTNSADFHAHLGYETVGVFRRCGYKFGRWYNMIWMEKCIGEYRDIQPPVIPYPELP